MPEVISGPCADDLHEMCVWPTDFDHLFHCSCKCHTEARAMPDTTATEAGSAEAQELEATGHYVTAEIGNQKLQVIPPGAWRQSWQRKLKAGDMDAFMSEVLSPDSYDIYLELDPTNDEIGDFLNRAADLAGEPMGKSSGSRASSSSTRRR
jgi:hypothetical protein